ncbi:MAG: glycosyltransferase family 9 protein [Gemmatimonadaceae bacterium]
MPRILIAKLAAMGDVIMASTLLPAIRAQWPAAHVTWLTDRALLPLVSRFEGVDDVIPVNASALLAGAPLPRASAMLACWKRLALQQWDLGLVAHADPRYRLLVRTARLGQLITQPPIRRHGNAPPRPWPWMGQSYADLLEGTSGGPTGGPTHRAQLAQLRPVPQSAPSAPRHGLLLAPGGARNLLRDDPLRRWPLTAWGSLAASLTAEGHAVTLIGGKHDRADCEQVAHMAPGVRNLAGTTTLSELVALVEQAQVVVTHDSGTLHLATLTRTPAVALFGPTVPAERIPPGAPVLVATSAQGLPCAPCYDGRDYAPCANNRCLSQLSVHQLLSLVHRQLHETPAAFAAMEHA